MTRLIAKLVPIVLVLSLVPLGPSAHAAFPGGNGDVAFARADDVWTLDPGTGLASRLTRSPRARESMPDWTADGTRVAFSACVRGDFANCEIWTIGADGTNRTRLTTTRRGVQETWPSWSPDGSMIAYVSNADDAFQDVWVMNADGSSQTNLTPNVETFDAFPEWSPDGTKIAFTSDRSALDDIWVMDADGANPTRLTSGRRIDERPDWSPDGSMLAFSRNGDIWVTDADGSNTTQLTDNRRFEFAPTFSPSGGRIAFNREGRNGRIGIWVMRADGSRPRQKTTGVLDFFPDWQPT